jgi:hypothetical protein
MIGAFFFVEHVAIILTHTLPMRQHCLSPPAANFAAYGIYSNGDPYWIAVDVSSLK